MECFKHAEHFTCIQSVASGRWNHVSAVFNSFIGRVFMNVLRPSTTSVVSIINILDRPNDLELTWMILLCYFNFVLTTNHSVVWLTTGVLPSLILILSLSYRWRILRKWLSYDSCFLFLRWLHSVSYSDVTLAREIVCWHFPYLTTFCETECSALQLTKTVNLTLKYY